MAAEEASRDRELEYLEVKCKSSGKTRRFAPGTDAGFAVSVINRKINSLNLTRKNGNKTPLPVAVHIQASFNAKRGSLSDSDSGSDSDTEPISFGPNSPLLNYGHGWILHTVVTPSSSSSGVGDDDDIRNPNSNRNPAVVSERPVPLTHHPHVNVSGSESSVPTKVTKPAAISLVYIGKIILAFILLFVLGAIFTLALENLPLLISFFTSSL